jgi:hypothetical protein
VLKKFDSVSVTLFCCHWCLRIGPNFLILGGPTVTWVIGKKMFLILQYLTLMQIKLEYYYISITIIIFIYISEIKIIIFTQLYLYGGLRSTSDSVRLEIIKYTLFLKK